MRTVMETFSGDWIDFADPDPANIHLEDIAHSLSLVCRFGGHIPFHWSVADHALLVRKLVIDAGHPELAKAALHHDSHEAYVGDVPTPLKARVGTAYRELVGELDVAIGTALGIDPWLFHAKPVVEADQKALRIEASHLKPSRGIQGAWQWRELPEYVPLTRRTPEMAEFDFRVAHRGHYERVEV